MTSETALQLDGPLVLVGAGNMGGALLMGWLGRGLSPADILVQDPGPPPALRAALAQHGIVVRERLPPPSRVPSVLLLAVKPQVMDDVVPAVAGFAGRETVVISVAAGRTIDSLARHFPPGTAIIRTIPNTPAAVGRGITVAVANGFVTPAQRALAGQLLAAVGAVGWVDDEALIDAATAISGSGPAYVFYLTECLAAAAVDLGIQPALAQQLARATVAGAGEMLHRSDTAPDVLRRNVTSPKGTTAAALDVLMAPDGLDPLLRRATAAARDRAVALAR